MEPPSDRHDAHNDEALGARRRGGEPEGSDEIR
jgi:hypothetical protein